METQLTKDIKQAIRGYKPRLPTKMRTVRWAEEVWTPTGIVDSIRFEDYYASERYVCAIIGYDGQPDRDKETAGHFHPIGTCFRDGTAAMDDKKCHGCVFRRHGYEVGMMITCYEVKITLSDFKSENGHNFHGNENYYVVPKELAPQIEPLVPSDIGILAYSNDGKQGRIRRYRRSGWREVEDSTKVMLLYNALKKWCDGAVFVAETECDVFSNEI